MRQLLTLYCLHWIGDFALQNTWVAENKGFHPVVMLAHCSVYAGLFYLCGFPQLFWLLLISHYIIDSAKARFGLGNLWTDQIMHHLVLIVGWIMMGATP